MIETMLYIGFAILLTVIIGIIIYSKGKNKGTPEISEFLEQKLNPLEHFKKIAFDFGEQCNKDLIQNMNIKKKVVQEKTIRRKIPEFYTASNEHIDFVKKVGVDPKKFEKFIEDKGLKSEPHRIVVLKDFNQGLLSKFFNSNEIALIPEKGIKFENEEKIVLEKDIDLNPVFNGKIWITDHFSTIQTYLSVAYQDLFEGQNEIMKENMKHLIYQNIKTAESMEKFEKAGSDKFKIGIAGDINQD